MLNIFPGLLTFSFFGPTLLRIAAALTIASIAYVHVQRREELSRIDFWLIGRQGTWLIWVGVVIEGIVALMLFAGYYTQLAAILGILMSIKHFIFAKKYPRAIPLCRVDYVFLIVILCSLLLTGAGALAMDLPL